MKRDMKKTIICITAVLAAVALLGCGHEHEWEEATCKKPKTCSICGETEGKPADHEWEEATCEKPKTCKVCHKTEGEPLGHEWVEATCEEPKTCSRCGATEGEPLGHDWQAATVDAPKTCKNCGATEGDPIDLKILDLSFLDAANWSSVINDDLCVAEYENPQHDFWYEFYNMDGELLHEMEVDCRLSGSSYAGKSFCTTDDCFMIATGEKGKTATIRLYDYDYNLLIEKDIKAGKLFGDQFPTMDYGNLSGCKRIYNDTTNETLLYFNLVSKQEIDEDAYTRAAEENNYTPPIYAEDTYRCCDEEPAVNGYFVSTPDDSSWGYVDEDGNEIAMYKDATSYSDSGYAFVTNDGSSYDLIDAEQNVVGEGVVKATSMYRHVANGHGNLFVAELRDGTYEYILVQ